MNLIGFRVFVKFVIVFIFLNNFQSAYCHPIAMDGMMQSPLDQGRDEVQLIRHGSYSHPQSDRHTVCIYGEQHGGGQNVSVVIRGYEHQCPFNATYNLINHQIKLGSRY